MQSDKIHYHPPGRVAAVVAEFYAGAVRREIAKRHGLALGAVSGLLSRANVVRSIPAGREPYLFDRAASQEFAARVLAGERWDLVAESMGKSNVSARGHAAALGLVPTAAEASAKAPGAPKAAARPIETSPRRADDTPEDKAQRERDARLAAALIAEGGFNRYDDTFDWLLNMHGARIAAVSPAAKADLAARRARLASAA